METILLAVALVVAFNVLPRLEGEGLSEIVETGARIEQIASGFKFTEGPVWHPIGYLLFSDIPADRIYKWTPGEGAPIVWRSPCGNTNGHTLDRQNRLVSCEHSGRKVSRTEVDGNISTLAERYMGARLSSPNDVVVKNDGSIYFTDPPYGLPNQGDGREVEQNGVYRLGVDGSLTLLTSSTRPNGLAFSPDEKRLYIANSDPNENLLRVFDVQADGTLANGRIFADLKSPGKEGLADGLKVDRRGNIFTTGPEGVWVFTPEGKLLGKIVPPEVPANVAFGGSDGKTLFMTARTGLYSIRLKHPGILPGNF